MSSLLHVPTSSQLKLLYADILRGYSVLDAKAGLDKITYIKHLSIYDSVNSDMVYEEELSRAKKMGLPTKDEQTEYLIKENLWTDDSERELINLKNALGNLYTTKSKIFLEQDVKNVRDQIEKTEKEVFTLTTKKTELLGLTAELHADKKSNEFYMQHVLYRDTECKIPHFTPEEFNDLTDVDIGVVFKQYQRKMHEIDTTNIRRLSLKNFFCNSYYLCEDNPMTFYGKPVVELTFNQGELFAYARYYKSISSDIKAKPPDSISDDPDALMEFYEGAKNAEEYREGMDQGKGSQGSGASTIVGASKKDLEKLGYGDAESAHAGIDLVQEAEKRGGQLDMQDFIDIHGR